MSRFPRAAACGVFAAMLAGATLFAQAPAPASPAIAAARLERVRAQIFASPDGLKNAVPELQAILALDPTLAEAHMLLGAAYRGLGTEIFAGEAKAELQQALELDPGLVAARLMLTQVYFDLGRCANARDEATVALQLVPGQSQLLASLAEAERCLGNAERALALSNLAIQADGRLPQARYYRGLALLDLGRRDEGIQQLQEVTNAGVVSPEVYLHLGSALTDAKRYDDAIATLTFGAKLGPSIREMRIELARAYRLKGSLVLADQQLTLAVGTPANVQVTTAYQRLEAALSRERGLLRLKQGRLSPAAEALQAAISMDPADAASHQALAEVYLRQGLLPKAREEAALAASLGAPLPESLQQRLGGTASTPPAKGQP
ncbi:MAG: tetratricopeptide repeat protein [Acidobacteriota bacterium]